MTRTTALILFYSGVALVSVAIVATAFWIRSSRPIPELPPVINAGREQVGKWFPIQRDLAAVNQDNTPVKLSDLRGKVWIVAEFFAVCPHCAVRNGAELREIYDAFKDHPDFHIACISVDPETDTPEKLADYSKALGADSSNWWFLNAGDADTTHQYLEQELKFFGIRKRTDPADIESNGRYDHDLGFLLVDREFNVIGKWPIADARSEEGKKLDPTGYQRLKDDLMARIRVELEKNETPTIE